MLDDNFGIDCTKAIVTLTWASGVSVTVPSQLIGHAFMKAALKNMKDTTTIRAMSTTLAELAKPYATPEGGVADFSEDDIKVIVQSFDRHHTLTRGRYN